MDDNGVACWGSPAAQRHTYHLAEALRLSLASMRKDSEHHTEAIAAAERELKAVHSLQVPAATRTDGSPSTLVRALRPLGVTLFGLGLFVLPGNLIANAIFSEKLCTEIGLASMVIGAPLAMQRRSDTRKN